jgi:hypothetical protein
VLWRVVALLALMGCKLHFDAEQRGDATVGVASDVSGDAFDLCAQPTTLLCDDFSAMPPNMVGSAQWLANGGRSGGGLQITGTAAMGGSSVYSIPTQTSGSFYARVYAQVQPGPTIAMYNVLLELNNAVVTGGQEKVSADIYMNDEWGIGAPYSGGGPSGTTTVARGTWTCIELQVDISSTAGAFHLFIDGTEVAGSTGVDTLIPSGFKEALVSSNVDPTDPDMTVLFDDLVIALAPIGC